MGAWAVRGACEAWARARRGHARRACGSGARGAPLLRRATHAARGGGRAPRRPGGSGAKPRAPRGGRGRRGRAGWGPRGGQISGPAPWALPRRSPPASRPPNRHRSAAHRPWRCGRRASSRTCPCRGQTSWRVGWGVGGGGKGEWGGVGAGEWPGSGRGRRFEALLRASHPARCRSSRAPEPPAGPPHLRAVDIRASATTRPAGAPSEPPPAPHARRAPPAPERAAGPSAPHA
jgi:hypothetical protein